MIFHFYFFWSIFKMFLYFSLVCYLIISFDLKLFNFLGFFSFSIYIFLIFKNFISNYNCVFWLFCSKIWFYTFSEYI